MPSQAGSRVLVDTSVWVDFLRGEPEVVSRLNLLMDRGSVIICGQIKQEVLQGSRDMAALQRLEKEMSIWPYEAEQPDDFVEAARTFAQLRWRGVTIPPGDCLIAAVARRLDLELFERDGHFRHIPHLQLY